MNNEAEDAASPRGGDGGSLIKGTLASIRIQPTPKVTRVAVLRDGGQVYTSIAREWEPGDAERCTRCFKCYAYRDGCSFIVRKLVTQEEAEDFSFNGCVTPQELYGRGTAFAQVSGHGRGAKYRVALNEPLPVGDGPVKLHEGFEDLDLASGELQDSAPVEDDVSHPEPDMILHLFVDGKSDDPMEVEDDA